MHALRRRYGRSATSRAAILAAADRLGIEHRDAPRRRTPADVDALQRVSRAAHRAADSALSRVVDGYIALRTRYGHARGSGLAAAVKAMRLYLGSVDFASVAAQQRFYERARRAAENVADSRGLAHSDAWDQLVNEARRQGIIRPMPGRHL
jgi:hypothetical protein